MYKREIKKYEHGGERRLLCLTKPNMPFQSQHSSHKMQRVTHTRQMSQYGRGKRQEVQLSLLSLYLKAMPTTDGARFDCILQVSFFFSTLMAKAHNISPSIISTTNHLEAVDAFAEAFITYACDGYDGPCTRGREAKEVLQLERAEQGGQGVLR